MLTLQGVQNMINEDYKALESVEELLVDEVKNPSALTQQVKEAAELLTRIRQTYWLGELTATITKVLELAEKANSEE